MVCSRRRLALLAFAVLLTLKPAAGQDPEQETPPAKPAKKLDMPQQRERWFYEQRMRPHGVIPGEARLNALARVAEMRKAERLRADDKQLPPSEQQAIAASTTVWTPIGPRPTDTLSIVGLVAGRTSAVAVNPLNQDEVYIGGAQGGLWRSMNGGVNWTPLTDAQASLAVGSIAIDASTCSAAPGPFCQTIYVGTGEQTFSGSSYYGAGILKTTDGGANPLTSWTQLTGVPVGGGTPFFVGPFNAVVGGARIGSLVIQPGTAGNTAVLLAGVQVFINPGDGSSSGIFRSADAGATWTQVQAGAVGTEVLFDPANPRTAYAALGSIFRTGSIADPENGIYKSTDDGQIWTKLTLPLPVAANNPGRIELAIGSPVAPSTEGVLYASIADATTQSNHLLGVIKSINGGANWARVAANDPLLGGGTATVCSPQCWYDHVIKVHPNDPDVAYLGGAAIGGSTPPGNFLLRTIDGGNSWAGIAFGPANRLHVDIQSMAFGFTGGLASRFYVGNDGGIWSADVTNPRAGGPPNWMNLNQDLQIMQFYPSPSFHPSTSDVGFGGTQDNGTQRYDGQLQWTDVTCGDGGWTVVDPTNGNNVYVTCQNIDLQRSTNGGNSFTGGFDNPLVTPTNPNPSPINQTDEVSFIPPFVIDPRDPQRLYFGTCRVWLNSAATAATPSWTAISLDLSSSASGAACPTGIPSLTALAVAPTNSDVVYAATQDGRIWRTTAALSGAGALNTWVNLNTAGLPVASRSVTWIAVHPTDPNTVFVTYSGFSGTFPTGNDPAGHVFRGSVTGPTAVWTDISGTLPNVPANVIVLDPDPARMDFAYLATDVGVFFANDANAASPGWTTLVTGLPNVAVLGLALHVPSRTLRAATHGRGMWDLVVPTNATFAVTGITPSTAIAGSAGFTLTVDGVGFSGTSVVRWNGQNRTPNLTQSATRLTVNIPVSDIAAQGSATIVVFDPAQPAPSVTNGRAFTITPAPPPNDPFAGAIVINTNPFTASVDTTNATNEVGDPVPSTACTSGFPNSGNNKTVWYRFTPTANVTANLDTFGSSYDTVLSVWTGAALGALTQFACNDDTGGLQSSITGLALIAGTTYRIMIGGFLPTDAGPTVFNFSIPLADLFVSLTDVPDPVNAGSSLMYNAQFSNAGPTAASNATLTYVMPANVSFVSASITGGSCSQAGGTVTCTLATLIAPNTVTVTIVVTPGAGAVGTLNAAVTVSSATPDPNNANNSAATTTTVNQPPDFSLSANPNVIAVNRGQSGNSTITLTALGGFASAVNLTCVGLPSLSNCSFSQASVTPVPAPGAASTLTITTTAGAMVVPPTPQFRWPQPHVLWPTLLAMLALLAMAAFASRRHRTLRAGFGLAAILLLAGEMTSCGGGGGGGGSVPPPPAPGTPRGTFTVAVTGTSGATVHTTNVTLTVN